MDALPALSIGGMLAQSDRGLTTVGDSIRLAVEALFTPLGAGAALSAAVFAAVCLFWRHGLLLAGSAQLYMLTLSYGDQRWFDNTLVQPFAALRTHGRSIAFVLLMLMLLKSLLGPRGWRTRIVLGATVVFALFQAYYLARLSLNEPLRGVLGLGSAAMTMLAFTVGIGKSIQDDSGLDRVVRMVGWASFGFLATNLLQISLSYGTSVASNRLVGVSGNAQLTGFICVVFILANAYLFARAPLLGPTRLVHGAAIGVLGLMLLWTGSRTGVLSGFVGILVFHRAQVGRLLVLGIIAGVVLLAASLVFSESFIGINRLIDGENTRRLVWTIALEEFAGAPLFGVIGERDQLVFSIESSLFSTLSLLGLSGAVPLMGFVMLLVGGLLRLWSLRWQGRVMPEAADLVLAWCASLLVASVFEGFLLGIMTFAVTVLYLSLAMLAYLFDDAEHPVEDDPEWEACDDASEPPLELSAQGAAAGQGFVEDQGFSRSYQ